MSYVPDTLGTRFRRAVCVSCALQARLAHVTGAFHTFITALKITWVRRIIFNSEIENWSYLAGIDFDKGVCLGDCYFKSVSRKLYNPFWKDLINSLQTFYTAVKIEKIDDILTSPIWCNSNLSSDENFIFNDWFLKGIRNIIDIIDSNGHLLTFEQLREQYNIKGTFLDYQRLVRKIPNTWIDTINTSNVECNLLKYNVQRNCYLGLILKDKKGSRNIYDILVPVREQFINERWKTEIGNITEEEQRKVNSNLRYINEIKLRDFQFKINNKILVTNSFLYKINKTDSHLCSFCRKDTESIHHLLCTCDKVREFWNTFKTWISQRINTTFNISDRNIIYSAFEKCSLINYLVVLAKYYIYKSKFHNQNLNIRGFEAYSKVKFFNEMYIAKINNTYEKFLGKWSPIYHYFMDAN